MTTTTLLSAAIYFALGCVVLGMVLCALRLAIARALMARPSCLLLDEPRMGLAPILVAQIFDVVKNMKALGGNFRIRDRIRHRQPRQRPEERERHSRHNH